MARKPSSYLGMDYEDFADQQDPADFFSMQGPVVPQAVLTAMSEPPVAAPLTPGKKPTEGKRSQKTKTIDNKTSTTKNLYADEDTFLNRANIIEQLPHIKGMEEGIQGMEDQLSMLKGMQPSNDSWVMPLLALADAQTGSNLAKNFKPGATARDIQSAVMEGKSNIQKQRTDMSKAIFEGMAKLKEGSQTDSRNERLMDMLMMQQGMGNTLDNRMAMQEQRNADIAHRQTVNMIRTNKPLATRVAQYQNLGNALAVLANADTVTPQQLHEAQQAIRSNIGIKGAGGVEERKDTYYNSLGLNAANWKQFLTGKPQDIKANKELMRHVKELALLEQANIEAQYETQLSALSGGHDWLYSDPRYAHYKKSLDNLIAAQGAQFKPIDRTKVKNKVHAQLDQSEQKHQVGEIVNGYKFKGGNWRDQNNWEAVDGE